MNTLKRPCIQKKRIVTQKDLPLSCPLPENRLWDAHPKVYLPIEMTGQEVCPYCSTVYILDAPVMPATFLSD